MTLTLNVVIHFFHRTLWLLMMYHQTKIGCHGINSSDNIIERVIFWLYEPLTLKIVTTTKCPHDSASWCCITIPNLVTKCSWFREHRPDKHSLTFWTFVLTLNLNTVIPFFMMLYYQTKFRCKPTSCLEDTTDIVIFWLYKPSLSPWHWTQWTNFSAWHFNLWRQNVL